jgi:hypothetical protein
MPAMENGARFRGDVMRPIRSAMVFIALALVSIGSATAQSRRRHGRESISTC